MRSLGEEVQALLARKMAGSSGFLGLFFTGLFLGPFLVAFCAALLFGGLFFGRQPLREGGCGDIDATGVCGICGSDPRAEEPRSRNERILS